MNTSGEAADQIVRMSLEAGEAALKITGAGAKHIAAALYVILKDKKKTKGKTRLETLVRSCKPLTVFSVKNSDLKDFVKEAKRYGILYCAVRSKKGFKDGMTDIIVKEEDAARINRIVERLQLASVGDTAKIKTKIERSKSEKTESLKTHTVPEKDMPEKSEEDKLMEELLGEPIQKEGKKQENPSLAKTESPHRSEPTLKKENNYRGNTSKSAKKPSVRAELKRIREGRKADVDKSDQNSRSKDIKPKGQKQLAHRQPNIKKKKNIKERSVLWIILILY